MDINKIYFLVCLSLIGCISIAIYIFAFNGIYQFRTQIKKTKTITKTEQVNVTDTSTTTIKEDTIELKSESLESNDSHESIVINTTTTVTTKKNVDNLDDIEE